MCNAAELHVILLLDQLSVLVNIETVLISNQNIGKISYWCIYEYQNAIHALVSTYLIGPVKIKHIVV